MEGKKSRDAELAEEFFSHDVENKKQVIDGYQELIEQAKDISDIHGYARKIRKTERDIERMAEKAEEIIENDETASVDIQDSIQESLDTLHCGMEYHDTSVGVNWDAENYTAELNPTVERMLYNLFDNSIEHGNTDVEIEVTDYEEGLMIKVEDGGEVEDWNSIFPEDAESREEYPSTGAYLIDQVAESNDINISGSDDWSYTVDIPFNTY